MSNLNLPPHAEYKAREALVPKATSIGNGIEWLVAGFRLFWKNPGIWVAGSLIFMVMLTLIAAIPIIGVCIVIILIPVFLAGFMTGADFLSNDKVFELDHIFSGYKRKVAGQLSLIGVICLLLLAVLGAVIFMLYTGSILTMGWELIFSHYFNLLLVFWVLSKLILPILLGLMLSIPIAMLCWFSPALVMLHGISAPLAMKKSFLACLLNALPFLIYFLVLSVFTMVAIITLGLGFLVLIPVVMASIYVAYQDIFLRY